MYSVITVWYWEVMNLGRYLADVLRAPEAAYFTCQITFLYSQTVALDNTGSSLLNAFSW